jgi:hypothetical protein
MTTKQPLALKLADEITESPWPETYVSEVAAELRRLHAENEALRRVLFTIAGWDDNSDLASPEEMARAALTGGKT